MRFTLTGLPVVLEHEAVRTEAEHSTHRWETSVRASGVVDTAWTCVLARVVIGRQNRVLDTLARAFVTTYEVSTRVLTGTVTVVQQAFVDVYISSIFSYFGLIILLFGDGNRSFFFYKIILYRFHFDLINFKIWFIIFVFIILVLNYSIDFCRVQ